MVSAKLFSVLGLASVAIASAIPDTSPNPQWQPFVEDLLAQNPRLEIWKWVQSDLDLLIPGVHCELGTPASKLLRRVTNEHIQAIEDNLSHLFPEIECEGIIDFEGLQNSTLDLETRDVSGFQLFARQSKSNADISTHEKNQVAETKAAESRTVTDCASATRPGNCRICAAGFAVACVAELGVCAAAGYAATAVTAGTAAPAVWSAFISCCAAALAALGAN